MGDCVIRGEVIEASNYLQDIACKVGFKKEKYFSYLIKNPYLRIPRNGKGGIIKFDKVLVLKKTSD